MGTRLRERRSVGERTRLDVLVLLIGRLVRHRGFVREEVVSAMLLRYLPTDAGYAWNGEPALRIRIAKAGLDATVIDHLVSSARLEIARIEDPARD